MHAEGVENHSRKEIRLDLKTGPLHRSSLLWDPICPIKKSCWQMPKVYCFMGGGDRGEKTQTCVFMHWKEGGAVGSTCR